MLAQTSPAKGRAAPRRLALHALLALAGLASWPGDAAELPRRSAPPLQRNAPVPQRLALVVGNARYERGPLKNAVNDARQVGRSLRELGFQVAVKENLDWDGMVKALADFSSQAQDHEVRLFYYAGHGMQIHGRNYLNPIGAAPATEHEARSKSVEVDELVDRLAQLSSGLSIVVVDACRRNPFIGVLRQTRGAAARGLAAMEAPRGMVVAFSTGPNGVAQDGQGAEHSTYTRHLLDELAVPGLSIEQVFKRVHLAVNRETGHAQQPWLSTSLVGDFCFRTLADGRCDQK